MSAFDEFGLLNRFCNVKKTIKKGKTIIKLSQKPHRYLVLMEHLFLSFAFKSASASQTQANSPCAHPFVSASLEFFEQTEPGPALTPVRPCASSALGVLWWGRGGGAGLQRSVSAGCTTGRKQPLSPQTSSSEASSPLTIYVG